MDKVKQLGLQMEQQMKNSLGYDDKSGFWYDKEDEDVFYTEEGIRLAVYEDLKDTLNYVYSDCACWVALHNKIAYNRIITTINNITLWII